MFLLNALLPRLECLDPSEQSNRDDTEDAVDNELLSLSKYPEYYRDSEPHCLSSEPFSMPVRYRREVDPPVNQAQRPCILLHCFYIYIYIYIYIYYIYIYIYIGGR